MSKKEYPAKLTTGYYRVREVWEDEASQLGSYRLLANAKAKCDENHAATNRACAFTGNWDFCAKPSPVPNCEEIPYQRDAEQRNQRPAGGCNAQTADQGVDGHRNGENDGFRNR